MTIKKSLLAVAAIGLLLTASLGESWAAASFNALSFQPTTDHGFYLTVEGSQTLGQWKFATHLTGEFSDESLILVNAAGNKVRDIIDQQFTLHLGAALGFTDWLNAGLLISLVPYQKFFIPATGVSDNGFRMSDITIDAKVRLLDQTKYPVGIAIVPFITIPSGNDSRFTGEGNVTGGGQVILESPRFGGRFSMVLNAGYLARERAVLSQGTTIDDQFLYGVAANFAAIPEVEIITEINGWTRVERFFDEDFRPMVAQGGIRIFPTPKLALTLGGGAAILKGMGAPTWRGFLTIGYVPAYRHYKPVPCVDTDGDGICDRKDRCPTEEGPKSRKGCPETPKIVIDEDANKIWHQKLYFDFDKATLKSESRPILDEMAASLKVRPDVHHVTIIGHTDHVGTEAYNQKLSERRAKTCRDYLIGQDLSPDRFVHFGRGELEPITTNATREGRSKNRRVEFRIEMAPPETVVTEPKPEPKPEPAPEPSEVMEEEAAPEAGTPRIASEPPVTTADEEPPPGGASE